MDYLTLVGVLSLLMVLTRVVLVAKYSYWKIMFEKAYSAQQDVPVVGYSSLGCKQETREFSELVGKLNKMGYLFQQTWCHAPVIQRVHRPLTSIDSSVMDVKDIICTYGISILFFSLIAVSIFLEINLFVLIAIVGTFKMISIAE